MPDETLSSWFEIPWRVYVAIIEGSAAETDGDSNWVAKLTSIVGVLVGLVLFSSTVAFITSVFEAKLAELRRGRSMVLENDHTIILGFGDRILEIIRELIDAGYPGCVGCGGPGSEEVWDEIQNREYIMKHFN